MNRLLLPGLLALLACEDKEDDTTAHTATSATTTSATSTATTSTATSTATSTTATTTGGTTEPAMVDSDGDGLSDDAEAAIGTDPNDADSDDDGLTDGEELREYGTDPMRADSDGDGLTDGEEVLEHGSDPISFDTDGDGRTDGDEVADGSDPNVPNPGDTDGDGWLDEDEELAGSDPENPFSWPFGTGQWPDFSDTAAADGVVGSGYGIGDIMPDSTLMDQFGNDVSLYQFYGYMIILEFGAGWCGPCQSAAPESQIMWEEYREQGVVVIHVMTGDWYDDPPDQAFLMEWATDFGLDLPVLGGDENVGDDMYWSFEDAGTIEAYIPAFVIIDRQMEIYDGWTAWSETMYDDALEDLL